MNGRALFRDYAKTKGKTTHEFVEIISEQYNIDTLVTKDTKGNLEHTTIDYKDMMHWIIRSK